MLRTRSRHTSKDAKHDSLCQILSEQSEAAGSQCLSYRSFASVARGPHQKQVRHIGAGDTEDQDNATQENEDRGFQCPTS